MAKKYHPDVNTSTDSTKKFSSINEAYSILSDKSKKERYDSMIGNTGNYRSAPSASRGASADSNQSTRNWWDFNFYGNSNAKSSNSNQSKSGYPETDGNATNSDFEFGQNLRDFYSDFSRFSGSTNHKKRKRNGFMNSEYNQYAQNEKRKTGGNPYSDFYYFQQQMNEEERRGQQSKYENIWSDFEFTIDVEEEFDSEFNNEAFWRFLRSNNRKHRANVNGNKSTANNQSNDSRHGPSERNEASKQRLREKLKSKEKERSNSSKRFGSKINGKHHTPKSSKNEKQTNSKNAEHSKSDHSKSEKSKSEKSEKIDFSEKSKSNKSAKSESKTRAHSVSENDIEIDLELDFLSAANGCTKNINFERHEICTHCGGTSFEPTVGSTRCLKCDGRGSIKGFGNDFVSHQCVNCLGRGVIFKNCGHCKGECTVKIAKSLTITIPSGIRENDRVRVSKQGHQYINVHGGNKQQRNGNQYSVPSIRYGHIWINVKILKHDYFVRISNDIHITMNIPYVLAVLGGSFVVPTIHGPNVIKIMAGINSNDYECMERKGIYDSSTNKTGNQYIHFLISVPRPDEISEEQRQLLNEYAKLESPPTPIKTPSVPNLKHFRKHGQRVTSFQEPEIEDETDSDDESDESDDDSDSEDDDDFAFDPFGDDEYELEDVEDDLEDLL